MIATQRAVLQMRRQGRGHVINVCSPSGFLGVPLMAGYSASKAALSGWTRTLQAEWRGTPIAVTEVLPGLIDTELGPASGRTPGLRRPPGRGLTQPDAEGLGVRERPGKGCSEVERSQRGFRLRIARGHRRGGRQSLLGRRRAMSCSPSRAAPGRGCDPGTERSDRTVEPALSAGSAARRRCAGGAARPPADPG